MMTLELDDETATQLNEMAEHEHISPAQLLRKLTQSYRSSQQTINIAPPELLTDFAGILKNSPSLNGDPLEIQQAMRDEWT